MINLTYRFEQNSSQLVISGIPDILNEDSDETIGILSSWKLKIIGSPLLEGEKEHLDNLMQVIFQYSRSYISGIKKLFVSSKNIVAISPFGLKHKLLLNSTKKNVKPLEIILDDSELSDLTRCLDLIRYDTRINIKWDIDLDRPFSKRYILSNMNKSKKNLHFFYAFSIFLSSSALLFFIPTNNNYQFRETNDLSIIRKNIID